MRTLFSLALLLITFVTNAQYDSSFNELPNTFSEELYELTAYRRVTTESVSDGYIVLRHENYRPTSDGECCGYKHDAVINKIDSVGNVVGRYDLTTLNKEVYGYTNPQVINDTIVVPLFYRRQTKSGLERNHPAYARFTKDLDLIAYDEAVDTLNGKLSNPFFRDVAYGVTTDQTLLRVNSGIYRTDSGSFDGLWVHKLQTSGEYTSTRLLEPYPSFINQMDVENDRVLVVGQGAFMVFDTNYNVAVGAIAFDDVDTPPVYGSNFAGLSARGVIANGSYYFFIEAHTGPSPDETQNCIAAHKFADGGVKVAQNVLWTAPDGRMETEFGYANSLSGTGYVYDGDTTIYALHERLRGDPAFPTTFEVSATDTNLNLLWHKVYNLPDDYWAPEDISLSSTGNRLLITGSTAPSQVDVPGQTINFLVSTTSGDVSGTAPAFLTEEADFLYPSLVKDETYLGEEYRGRVEEVEVYGLGDGRRSVYNADAGALDLSALPSGVYIALGKRRDGQPTLRQRIVVTH